MTRRLISCCLAGSALLMLAAVLWLPFGFGPRTQADTQPDPPSQAMKLVSSECAFFVTFRPADFTSDDLAKAVLQELPKQLERELGTPMGDIDRVTFALVRGGFVKVVQTRRAYDGDKLRDAFTKNRWGGDKDIRKDGAPARPAVSDMKAGGKTIHFVGQFQPWTDGWCRFDRTTYLHGEVTALKNLLEAKGKPSAEMADALALATRHSLVLGLEGKRLLAVVKHQREEAERERDRWRKGRRLDKDKDGRFDRDDDVRFEDGRQAVAARAARAAQKAAQEMKEKKADEDDLDALFERGPDMMLMLPYKPLLKAKFALLTADIKKTYTLSAKVSCKSKDDADDAETALKMLLYMGREMAVMLPKNEWEFKGMKALSAPVQKAFKEAKVVRKDDTLSVTVKLTPEAGLAKKVAEGIAEERKNRDRDRRFDKDRPDFKDRRFDDKEKK